MFRATVMLAAVVLSASSASAQSLGTFKWQLQPYCNVVSVNVTGVAGVYTLEGFDDQCGAGTRAPLTGVATPNPDGTIGFGLNLVTSPGGRGIQVEARISLASLGGPWADSDGNKGTFAFNRSTGGSPRPVPANPSVIPPIFGLRTDGGFVAGGSAGLSAIPASGPGTRMMWHPGKSAFRAGAVSAQHWDDGEIGTGSAAFGINTIASGAGAFAHGRFVSALGQTSAAFGSSTVAQGDSSFAAGNTTLAGGPNSVAFGSHTVAAGAAAFAAGFDSTATGPLAMAFGNRAKAEGPASLAFGTDSRASGSGSLAMGENTTAGGSRSVALGSAVNTAGTETVALGNLLQVAGQGSVALGHNAGTTVGGSGSFLFGDRSVGSAFLQSFAPNQFLVRAGGGATVFTNGGLTTGVKVAPGASSWSSLSDVNSKEHFRDLDGGDVLAKIARMPIREWNYKAQDAAIRHVGPTAQDFHAAFGLGEDPLRISTIDADGIALAGVKALESRTRPLAAENAALREQLAQLSGDYQSLKAHLDALVARLEELAARR